MTKTDHDGSALSKLKNVLLVEDDEGVRRSLARVVRRWGNAEVHEASTLAEAEALLAKDPDLLIADVALPDGDIFGLLEKASHMRPAPVAVAVSGQVSTEEAFRLAQLGVRAFLEKPFEIETLTQRVAAALESPPSLEALVAASVGRTPMRELQGEVRRVMVEQALAQAKGSRSGAARLLNVSRQAVQQMVRERGSEGEPGNGHDE